MLYLVKLNKFIPRTEKIKRKRNISPKIFIKCGSAMIKVYNITLKCLLLLMIVSIFMILKDLNIEVTEPSEYPEFTLDIIIPIKESNDKKKSNIFQFT